MRIGRALASLQLDVLGIEVKSLRRRGERARAPAPETVIQEGDVLVLLGLEQSLGAAEIKLLQG